MNTQLKILLLNTLLNNQKKTFFALYFELECISTGLHAEGWLVNPTRWDDSRRELAEILFREILTETFGEQGA